MASQGKPSQPKDPSEALDGAFEIQPIRPIKSPSASIPSSPLEVETGEFSREEPFKGPYATREGIRFREKEAAARARARWKKYLIVGILSLGGLLGVCALVLQYSPAAQRWAKRQRIVIQAWGLPAELSYAISKPFAYWEEKLSKMEAPGGGSSSLRPWSSMDCKFLIQEALSRKIKAPLDSEGSYLLLACQLANDMPTVASQMLRESNVLSPISASTPWKELPERLIAHEVQMRMQTLSAAAPPRSPGCPRWKGTPACMLRYVQQARQALQTKQEGAFTLLEKSFPKSEPRLRVWLLWAAGLIAIKESRGPEGEKRLEAAAKLLQKIYDPFMEREVFRARVRNAMNLRDPQLMNKVWQQRPQKRIREDGSAYLDVDLMRKTVLRPLSAAEELTAFLDRPESYQRFRFDPAFIRWVVEQGIFNGRTKEAGAYLERLVVQENEGRIVAPVEWIDLLRIRLLLAQRRGLESLQKIQAVERYVPRSAQLMHLKGLGLLHAFTSKPYRMKAAQEFQKAINNGGRNPSYFAMIMAFLEAKETVKAEAALSFWQKEPVKGGDRLWVGLARSLIRYQYGELEAVTRLWRELGAEFPEAQFIRKLEQNLRDDPKFLENQIFMPISEILPLKSPLGPLVDLSQKS